MRFLTALLLSFCLIHPVFAADPQPVNINTADADTLVQGLQGIGPSKAEAIIEYRETYGKFAAIEELEDVKGIGAATIAKNRDVIVLQ